MAENFARGRSAEIFRVDDGKIMKLFFADYPREYAEKEYANTIIASEVGCISMKAYDKVEKDGRFGFVMDFIDGVSQNDMPSKNPAYVFKAGKDLAKCHVEVQSKKAHGLEDVREQCVRILGTEVMDPDALLSDETMSFLNDDEKARAEAYLRSLPDEDGVLHLDFHTGNVLVDDKGECTVIDWMTAARGNRAVEYALMEFLFSEAELFPEASELQRTFMGLIRGSIGKQFYKEYNRLTPISPEEVDRYRLLALIIRRSWNIEFERPYLTSAIRSLIVRYCWPGNAEMDK